MPYEINIKLPLSDEFIGDVMTTMVESNYAAMFYWEDFQMLSVDRGSDLSVKFIRCKSSDGNGEVKEYIIDPLTVAKAIEDILAGKVSLGYPKDYISRGVREADAGDIDATAADCIAQVVCFGEVVYG